MVRGIPYACRNDSLNGRISNERGKANTRYDFRGKSLIAFRVLTLTSNYFDEFISDCGENKMAWKVLAVIHMEKQLKKDQSIQ